MSRGKSSVWIVGILTCLLAGAGLERVRQAVMTPPPEVAPLPETPTAFATAPGGTDDARIQEAMALLRKHNAELENALKAREDELAALKQQNKSTAETAVTSRRPQGPEAFRQRMEKLKKENPALYAEMEKRREEMRQHIEQEKQDRADFLTSLNTQNMSDAQKANHEKLLETLAKIEALRAQREQAKTDPGSEADLASHEAMHQTMDELRACYDVERQYLLTQAANAAGYEGNDADSFVDYIQTAIQSTTMQGPGGPGGGGPPPGM